jgi:hypothetical protein
LSFDTIELINFLEKLNNDYRTIDGMHSSYTDVEAEFASFFAETYVK